MYEKWCKKENCKEEECWDTGPLAVVGFQITV